MALKKKSMEMFEVSNPQETMPKDPIAVSKTGKKKLRWKWTMSKVRKTRK